MSASISPWPRRPTLRSKFCGWWLPPGSTTEALHHERCILPRQPVERRAA
jgi:hypothetical protein